MSAEDKRSKNVTSSIVLCSVYEARRKRSVLNPWLVKAYFQYSVPFV